MVRAKEDEDGRSAAVSSPVVGTRVLRYVDLAIVLTGIKSGTLLGATVIRCRRN